MSNQDRLLSDEDLKDKATNLLAQAFDTGVESNYIRFNELEAELANLINTQKRLYTESIIDNALEDVADYQAMSNRATATVKELMNPEAGLRSYAKYSAGQRVRIKW